jgi:type IV secretion system protein VirB11
MTYARLHGISVMAAAQTRQVITPRNPILSTDILGDLRLQSMMPPTVPPGTMAVTLRRGDKALDDVTDVPRLFDISRWNQWAGRRERRRARDGILLDLFDSGNLPGLLQALADTRQTGLFVGPTGAGKTRLSKMMGGAISEKERIIAVEDAAELIIRQPNHIRHFYSASGQGISPAALLKATLRERPDRVMLAEMRDAEAASVFLDEVGRPSGQPVHPAWPQCTGRCAAAVRPGQGQQSRPGHGRRNCRAAARQRHRFHHSG